MSITKEMYDALMKKISENGELTKQSETNITTRFSEFETKYDKALVDLENRHKAEISDLKDSFKQENDGLKSELDSIRQLIEGKSENIKLSDRAVENVVKHVATDQFKKLEISVSSANEKNNSTEQYTRNWCLRIYGVPVLQSRESKVGTVKAAMEAVYSNVVQPILGEVVSRENSGLDSVPDLINCIENAHKLGKETTVNGKTLPPCIIVRFMKREIRDLVIKNRKLVPPLGQNLVEGGGERVSAGATVGVTQEGGGKPRIVEDLTRLNHQRLQALIADQRVEKVWSIQGKFRVILKDDNKKTVINCKGSLVSVEDLVKKYCKP